MELFKAAVWIKNVKNVFDIDKFVSMWMEEIPAHVRKTYSHCGAVRKRCNTDPLHYQCPHTNVSYFDPGNSTYALALSVMAPTVCQAQNWNIETKGDIIEGVLGLAYLKEYHDRNKSNENTRVLYKNVACRVAELFEEVTYRTINLSRKVGENELQDWVHRIMRWVYP